MTDNRSKDGKRLIFRRFRRLPNGKVLDAWAYGLNAWPIYVDK